jgi:hypothetical protein
MSVFEIENAYFASFVKLRNLMSDVQTSLNRMDRAPKSGDKEKFMTEYVNLKKRLEKIPKTTECEELAHGRKNLLVMLARLRQKLLSIDYTTYHERD